MAAPPQKLRRRLFRRYALLFMAVVSLTLIASSATQSWFVYREEVQGLERVQREQAEAAAGKILQFVREIQSQMGWTTQLAFSRDNLDQRRFDALRLLRQVPAITELSEIDPTGREQLRVSRLARDLIGQGLDLSNDPKFLMAIEKKVYFGPVYFRRDSEPYMTIAQAGSRRDAGVAVAEVNLKFIWEVVSKISVGKSGAAYVVNSDGRLIAHPDISLVLGNTNLSHLPQVRTALASDTHSADLTGVDIDGRKVISAQVRLPELGWTVLVELPLTEALAPLYETIYRSLLLLLAGLIVAVLSSLFLARRIAVPIRRLQQGADEIGEGELTKRIEIATGDELEALANSFNQMAGRLHQSHAQLENRVRERTEELNRKGEQLELANQHKSQFLANMSHELRTPLNAVLGYTELMVDEIYGALPARARQVLERVQANGKHLLALINDVLDMSRIEAGQLSLAVSDYDAGTIARIVVSALEPLASAKGLELRLQIEPNLPRGRGDERRLTQVLLNLVGNAIKFTDSGEVAISVGSQPGQFLFQVRDTGAGIAPADQARIFEDFQQLDDSSTRSKGGSGLGLAISKRLVEMHGGSIILQSAPGDGSVFTVLVPMTLDALEAAA